MAQKFRNYCYTLNNWKIEEYNALQTIECKYQIIGKEIGEKVHHIYKDLLHLKVQEASTQ